MNHLAKIEPKKGTLKILMFHLLDFLFSYAIGISGAVILLAYLITDIPIYLKLASILSIFIMFIFSLMNLISLIRFGLQTLIVEVEVKFLDLSLYSFFIFITSLFLFLEQFN